MRASGSVYASLRQGKALNRAAVHEVLLHNFRNILRTDKTISDLIRVDHNRGPVLALIETSRRVGADLRLQASLRDLLLEDLL
jgi:hypothetical protein